MKSNTQLVLSTLSLVVWIYAMGTGPLRFLHPPYYEPWHGAVLLAVWTLVPPMLLTQVPGETAPSGPVKAVPFEKERRQAPVGAKAPLEPSQRVREHRARAGEVDPLQSPAAAAELVPSSNHTRAS